MQRLEEPTSSFDEYELSKENQDSISDLKSESLSSQNDSTCPEKSDNSQNELETLKIVSTPKWQITLTSEDCTIKKHFEGWQICPLNSSTPEDPNIILRLSNSKMNSTANSDRVKTVNAEICCNRDNLDDLLGEEEKEDNPGKIMLREYFKLLPSEGAKLSFISKILTKAVQEHKVFMIYGSFPVLKKPLGKRGWIEKRAIRRMLSLSPEVNDGHGLEAIEKLLRAPADFIWYTTKRVSIRSEEKTIVNKFTGCYFTSKVDMCNNLENVSWFYEPGVSNIHFPRCYNVYQQAQVEEFVRDFYITACMGILKWFLYLANLAGSNATWSPNGIVPINAVLFALERCVEYISVHTHEDIDREDYKGAPISDWNQFLMWHKQIVNDRELLIENDNVDINAILKFTAHTLADMIECRPQSRIDGIRNVWIVKPGDKSLGRGIVLKNDLNDILQKINLAAKESMQYVVQKYIERPLLVHKTKVDVRQWFLITSTHPLIVWMYKDILLRFASKDFTLDNFHESIHLCNTTVQLKYRKLVRSNMQIPNELHWNLQNFKDYLKATNRETAWEKIIKPGIKQNLIGALLASQENMVNRKNSFQLYGADFVILDDLSVWLIEINTNPRLNPPSSAVTEKLYPEVIEDTMKVVLDRRRSKKAARGKFECIYKQRNPYYGSVLGQGASLGIRGKAISIPPATSRK